MLSSEHTIFLVACVICPPAFMWGMQYYGAWFLWAIRQLRTIYHNQCQPESLLLEAEEPPTPVVRPDKAYETKYDAMYDALINAYEACPTERGDAAGEEWIQEKQANLMRNYLLEHTPIGNCVIRFNAADGAFEYFSDRVLPYRLLESVGKKYVRMFFCKPIYVDLKKALKEAEDKKTALLESEAEIASTARLNQLRNRRLNSAKQIMESKMSTALSKMTKECEVDPAYRAMLENDVIRRGIKNASNSYIHKGPFANFSVQPDQHPDAEKANNSILHRKPPHTEKDPSTLTFAEFKKMAEAAARH